MDRPISLCAVPRYRPRDVVLVVLLLMGIGKLVLAFHEHYPIQHWLFWRYLGVWAVAAAFTVACVLVGAGWIRLLRLVLPWRERAILAFALGVFSFFLSMFVGGLLRLYGSGFALILPLLLGAVGGWSCRRRWVRMLALLTRAIHAPIRIDSPLALALGIFGVLAVVLLYLPILTPDNACADARWYHLTLAEHYVAAHGIVRFPEGAVVAAFPQLATILYTWAFLLPGTTLFDRIELAAHLEFVLFLWTLAGVAVLAARINRHRKLGLYWTAVLLFPGVYIYDSSLSLGADHVLAFWAPPIFLALLRAYPCLSIRPCLALAAMLAGAASTKYQAGCLVVPPVVAIVARALQLSAGQRRRRHELLVWLGPGLAGALAVLLTAPHWAKNWIWYGDPVFPFLHQYFPVRPWEKGATANFDATFLHKLWRPEGGLGEQVMETALGLFNFSFEPHDWEQSHGSVPVFGSLFTLTSLCAIGLTRVRRLAGLLLCTYGALGVWYWVSHTDRYLQGILPWMAAATGACVARLFEQGPVIRAATGTLIGLQLIWGGDVPFIPAHPFIEGGPYRRVVELLSSGFRRDYVGRLRPFGPWSYIGERLPIDAKVLVHGDLGPLGLGRMTVTDITGWQSGISYGYRSAADLYRGLRSLGVTHLLWIPDSGQQWRSIADDFMFHWFALRHTEQRWSVAVYHVGQLPDAPPQEGDPGLVLVWGAVEGYASGLYPMSDLTIPCCGQHSSEGHPVPLHALHGQETKLLRYANFLALDADLGVATSEAHIRGNFTRIAHSGKTELWARTGPEPALPLADLPAVGSEL